MRNWFAALAAVIVLFSSASPLQAQARLSCSANAPDSVFFDKVSWDAYIPGTFSVDVVVTNTGSEDADSVTAFIRTNERFTSDSPAPKQLSAKLQPDSSVYTTFTLTVKPRQVSGWDTICVQLSAKAGVRGECCIAIWVEKEYKPLNGIVCAPDNFIVPVWDDELNDYIPNPVTVPVSIKNIGDAPSKNTKLFFVATEGVSLADGQPQWYDFGTLDPGESRDTVFRLNLVRRNDDIVVCLPFRVQGEGGLKDFQGNDPIIDSICCSNLPIPASREVFFDISCENDIKITFENEVYSPNPFEWSTIVKNTGTAKAYGVYAEIDLPFAYQLEAGYNSRVELDELEPDEERTVSWMVRIKPQDYPDTSEICTRVADVFGREDVCCDSLILPATREPDLTANCSILPDTIYVDPETGEYLPATFTVQLNIDNPGTETVDSVYAYINLADPDVELVTPSEIKKFASVKLLPNGHVQLSWDLRPLQTTVGRMVTVQFRVTGLNVIDYTTTCEVYIHASVLPQLQCVDASTTPADTVHYDIITLRYEELFFTATVKNIGANAADTVRATILLPPNISLVTGEQAVRKLPKEQMQRDDEWSVTWKLLPYTRKEGTLDTVRVEFRTGKTKVICQTVIFIVGIPPVTAVIIPSDVIARHGKSARLPIRIDDATGKDIHEMEVFVQYDPAKLLFDGFDTEGTMMQNWSFTDISVPGRLAFAAENRDTSLAGSGILVNMDFTVTFGLGPDILNTEVAELRFDSVASSMNLGSILVRYYNGAIYVSGDCLYPLVATEDYVVLQNSPNPFNPSTEIMYHLPDDAWVSLRVFNTLGREVAALHEGPQTAGNHSVRFDASHLPAGTYFCLLRAGEHTKSLKLLLLK